MKNQISFLLLSVILIAICHSVTGVIAYPYPVDIIQPDGTKITIILKGDEHVKWAVTTDGYTILLNNKGIYEYAVLNSVDDMVPSGIPVRNQNERKSSDIQFLNNTGKDLTYSKSQVEMMKSISKMYEKSAEKVFPTKGSRKLVCILMGFSDKAFTKTKADFENLFNQVGYSADGATGSIYDFYKENSFNQLDLTVTVAGPYTAANTVAYYGGNDSNGNDLRPRDLVTEAVKLADPDVNYADFDNDGDGTVDAVYVIYAGYGEEAGGGANAIWAHAWSITSLTLDGKTVSRYSCSPELRGSSGTGLTRIGVICHEFGHVMGAMDYYDTDYSVNGQFTGTGKWDLMANGSWNNSGTTPAHHNPYTKVISYGWAEAPVLTSATSINITLNDAEQNSNSFYRVNTVKSNEYFLIENRQQYKFDTFIPGHGMIIYHVDGNYISTAGNQINAGIHQGMYPVCANATGNPTATYGVIDNDGLPFPGSGIKTSFTDAFTPNSKCWQGANTNKPVTNITENTTLKTVSFSFILNTTAPTAITSSASAISPVSAKINALVSGNGATTTISFEYGTTTSYGNTVNGTPGTVTGENLTDITASMTGLTANIVYNYRVKAVNSIGTTYGSNMTFKTVRLAQPGDLTAAIQNPDLGTVKLDWKYAGAGIFEDFENATADNFVFFDNRTFIENGMLTASGAGNNTWAEAYYNKNFQDFTLEYRVRRNQGSTSSSIGMMFRSTGLNNTSNLTGYLFNITAGGSYSAWKFTSGTATSLIPWTSSSAINTGIDSWNIVTIEARGNIVKFYINSQYVNQITDATYTSGRFVFGAYMTSGYTNKVNWDDISIIPQSGVLKNPSGLVKAINTKLDDSGTSDKAPEYVSVNNNINIEVKGLISEVNAIAMPFRYFKIYRNGTMLDTTSLTSYSNTLPSYGTYEYKVTAKYDIGESDPAGPVSIRWYGNPIISVNPLSFNETLMRGDSVSRDLTIKNNGNGILIYTIPLTKKANTWLSASVLTDTLLMGESSVIKIKFNAKNLVADDYTDTLRISSTDLNNPTIKVPCTMHVLGKPTADFSANSTQILPGDNLQFTDLTSGSPTSWKWRFPSGSPSASTEQNPKVSYGSLGSFNVTLIATNGYGSDSITKIGYITVKNMQYCTSNLGGTGSCPGDISLVSIAGTSLINTDHSICSTENNSTYGSYPAVGNRTGTVEKGKTYSLSVTTTIADIISVWIDYNHNSVFEASEWTQVSLSTVINVPSTISITIPANAVDGNTGMRIRSRLSSNINGAGDACTFFGSGITEDYIITIGLSQTPTLETTPVSAITLTSATSGGNITSDGNAAITARGVCWSTTAGPTIALATKTTDGTGIGTFTSSITGLTAGTTYHVRAYATNIAGTAYGTDITFTTCTAAVIPTLTTKPVSAITLNAGISGGTVTSGGCAPITAMGICWSTTANPTIALTTKTTDGTGTGDFISNITGLAPGITYHVRAYATNSVGTGYGTDISFTTCTTVVLPTITTASVTTITTSSAATGGIIASGGCAEVTAKGVCWSTSANPTTALSTKTNNGAGEGSFTSNITGLTGGTTYHVRAYATNSTGTGYGADISFTCPPDAPVATSPANITLTGFTANWNSSLAATGYYLDVSTNSGFVTYLSGFNSKDVGNLTSTVVAGLNDNSTYYYRVRAYGSGGTSTNSNIITLTTLPIRPSAPIAGSATNILQTSFTANWSSSAAATGYQLDVSTSSAFATFISGYNSKDIGNTTSVSVTGLIANTAYYYRVRAYNIGGASLNSGTISTTTLRNAPPAPLANSATSIVQTSFTSNWTSSATAEGYRLDVSTNSAFTSFLSGYNNKDIGNQVNASVTGLTAKTSYYYRLRSYNTGGTSANSNIITVTTLTVPPASPTGFTASSCNNLITLKWRKNTEPDFSRYRIYGGSTNNPTIKIDSAINASSDTVTKVISGLTHGLTYYFRVTAVNYDGPESPFSSQSSATVKTGVIPRIKSKWGDVLICSNLGDSIKGFKWYKGNSLISFATGQYYVTNKQPGIYKAETIDLNGCKNSSNAISTSGTKSLSAFPNPASVNFSLKLNDAPEGRAVISILTSAGIKVLEFEVENVTGELLKEIPVSTLDDGIYIVQVLLDNKDIYFTKIIVKK